MRIWRAFRVFYQTVTDREIYFLLGLASRDLFRKTQSDPQAVTPVKKRAKAIAAGQSSTAPHSIGDAPDQRRKSK
jgi:hypothetical protein